MSLLETINTMKASVEQAQALIAQTEPFKKQFDELRPQLDVLTKGTNYYGVNPDGSITLVFFDPNGNPAFNTAIPLPEPAPDSIAAKVEAMPAQ